MAFERARTALLNITERLRRVFGSAGEIPLDLKSDLIPVVITSDLREPGSAPYRGRFFSLALANTNLAASNGWVIRFQVAVVIDFFGVNMTVAGTGMEAWTLPPGTNPTNVPATQGGAWCDNRENITDRPPILVFADAGASLAAETAPTVANRLFSAPQGINPQCSIYPKWHFPAGTTLLIRLQSTGTTGQCAPLINGHIA